MTWKGNSPNRARGSQWSSLRAKVLREERFCRECLRFDHEPSRAVICDHITPLAEGGTNDRSNLAGMCRTHHTEKTMAESARAQGKREPTPRAMIGADGWPAPLRG